MKKLLFVLLVCSSIVWASGFEMSKDYVVGKVFYVFGIDSCSKFGGSPDERCPYIIKSFVKDSDITENSGIPGYDSYYPLEPVPTAYDIVDSCYITDDINASETFKDYSTKECSSMFVSYTTQGGITDVQLWFFTQQSATDFYDAIKTDPRILDFESLDVGTCPKAANSVVVIPL